MDGDRAIVGAIQEDDPTNGTSNAGAAYVFERNGSGAWTETQVLRASNAGASDLFGISVSIDGDRAFVGAFFEDGPTNGTLDAGAAYVYNLALNDPPLFTATGPFSLPEGWPDGTSVGDVDANDGNGGATDAGLTYSILSGNVDVDGDTNLPFAIDAATGALSVNDGGDLNFEGSTPSFTLTVQADDGQSSNNTATATVTVTVTDEPPALPTDADATTNQVNEGAPAGLSVGLTAQAIDPAGGTVTYVLTDDASGRFTIDSATGVVKVANGSLLDYETSTSHTVSVQAEDADGTASATEDFTIQVLDQLPEITVTDGSAAIANGGTFDYGTIDLRTTTTATQVFTVENVGNDDLTLSSVQTLSPSPGSGAFSILSAPPLPAVIAPAGSVTFEVAVTPNAGPGPYSVTLSASNTDPDENPFTFTATATAIAPEIDVTDGTNPIAGGGNFDFGNVALGSSDTQTFTLENNGNAPLTITSSSLSGSSDFQITASPAASVASSTTTTLDVTYTPSSVGPASATLTVASDDPDESSYTIALTGTGQNTAPTVASPIADFSVIEDASPSTVDLTTIFSDAETPAADLLFAVASNDTPSLLTAAVDNTTDELTLTYLADQNGTATIEVSAEDPLGESATTTFAVTVTPVNDSPTLATTTLATDEDTPVTLDLRTVAADLETIDDDLTFSVSNATNGTVALLADGVTAEFTPAPGYNGPATFDASVTDTPEGSSPALTTGPVTFDVTVNEVNDPPALTLTPAAASLDENVPGPSVVSTIAVTDDGSGTNSLSLSGPDAASFAIDDTDLQFTPTADFETKSSYTVTVNVDDPALGSGPEASETFELTIADVNEAPALALSPTSLSLLESTDTGSPVPVSSITITDDALGANQLALSGPDASVFTIVGTDLTLAAGTPLDADVQAAYSVTVTVDDPALGSGPEASETFALTLTDVNSAPTLALAPTNASLPENTPGPTTVSTITITDDASGTNQLGLTGPDASSFALSGLDLQFTGTADFETQASYSVTVSVDDPGLGSGPDDSAPFTLTITDENEAPTLALAPPSASLPENTDTSTPVNVSNITVTDDGLGTNTLSLAGTDASAFQLDGTALQLAAGTTLDADVQSTYTVTVTVDDATLGSGAVDSETFTLTVTDVNSAPTLALNPTNASLPENTAGPTTVSTVTVTDDVSGTNQLSLSGPDAPSFALSGTDLQFTAVADFEAKSSYAVTVEVDDPTIGSGPEDSQAFSLTITDENEAPSLALSPTSTSLPENTDTSSPVALAAITITDDALGTNTLSLNGADASAFQIAGTDLQLAGGTSLDADTKSSYSVTVTVDDPALGSGAEASAVFALTITDVNSAPTLALTPANASLPENNGGPVVVSTVTITDDASGTNPLSLSGPDAGSFALSGTDLQFTATADFEAKSSYAVTVIVDDPALGSGPEDSESLTLTITDVNEAPALTLSPTSASLPETTDTASPVTVAAIAITDDALGTNTLSLDGADAASFQISGTDLQLAGGTSLDASAKVSYAVTVRVDDPALGSGPEATETFTLTVTDVNEAPTLALTPENASIPENNAGPVVVSTATVTDDVLGTNQLGLTGPDAADFDLDGTDLQFTATADFEAKSSYSVTVTVDDPTIGTGPEDEVAFALTITDVPEGLITGRVWQDANGDGLQQAGEQGIPGVTLTLTPTSLPTTTDASGAYTFGPLAPGLYTVAVDAATLSPRYSPTFDSDGLSTPSAVQVLVADAGSSDANFGYTEEAAALTVRGLDGTGNDTGYRMMGLPAPATRADLEDDVMGFGTLSSGYLAYTYDGGQWRPLNSPNSPVERGEGFVLYFFDDGIQPLGSGGIEVDVPLRGADQTANVTVSGFDRSDLFELVGNPYDRAFDLSALGPVGAPTAQSLPDAGFSRVVLVWDGRQYVPVVQGDPGAQIPAFNSFVLQRLVRGSGAEALEFDASGRQAGPGAFIGGFATGGALAGTANTDASVQAKGTSDTVQAKTASETGIQVIGLQLAVDAPGGIRSESRATLRFDPTSTEKWDALDVEALPPPTATNGYAVVGFPLSTGSKSRLRSYAGEPAPTTATPIDVPLDIQSVQLNGQATLSWPSDWQAPSHVDENWTVELIDTRPGGNAGAESVVHDLRSGPYAFDVVADAKNADAKNADAKRSDGDARFFLRVTSVGLPIQIAGFRATRSEQSIQLAWETISEINNAGFDIERQVAPGQPWTNIGFVRGAGTSSEPRSYRFTDGRVPFTADKLTYRLRQTNLDGTKNYSEEIIVAVGISLVTRLAEPFPNPARSRMTVRYELQAPSKIRIDVYDLLGRQVLTLAQGDRPAGRVEESVDTSGLSSGMYFLRMMADQRGYTQRFVVVR
jgi:hypothetical protein